MNAGQPSEVSIKSRCCRPLLDLTALPPPLLHYQSSRSTIPRLLAAPFVWDILTVKSDIPNTPPDPIFDPYFALSGISYVHQLEEVDAFKSDTDNTFIDGICPNVMFMFDLHVPDSAPTHHDDLGDHQVKAISTASVRLLNSNGARVTHFHEKRTNTRAAIDSYLRRG